MPQVVHEATEYRTEHKELLQVSIAIYVHVQL